MKRTTLARMCFALCAAILPVCASAQTDETPDSVAVSTPTAVDSLKQVVETLQQENASMKEDLYHQKVWKRKKHFNISLLTSSTMTYKDIAGLELKKDFGANISLGRTWYLPSKPILGMIKFGIDWDYIDISYVKFKDWSKGLPTTADESTDNTPSTTAYSDKESSNEESSEEEKSSLDYGSHLLSFSWGFGPSVTINPVNYLKVGAYFHWQPTAAVSLMDSKASWGCIANSWAFGMHASWKCIGLGFETRWGNGKLSSFDFDKAESDVSDGVEDSAGEHWGVDQDGLYNKKDYTVDEVAGWLSTEKQKVKIKSFLFYITFRF